MVGGLYTVCSPGIGNGIERGAGFEQDNAWFGFEDTDFGNMGSDTVTVPIYANMTTPVQIKFYDGIPDQGGELIGDFTYHEPPEWLTYKANTFKLTKKLHGVHTFVMQSSDRYHVKGFSFERQNNSFDPHFAASCQKIYGDSFMVSPDIVTGIGNNVVLDFGEFDFTEPPQFVVISGKAKIPLNSIHLIFKPEQGTPQRILAEFRGCTENTEQVFPVEGITGKGNVSFTFLPGSDFDFNYFQFIK